MPLVPLAPRSLLACVAVVAIALCTACGDPSADKQLAELRSWTATLHLAAEQGGRGAIPARYATQLREQATHALAGASIEKGDGAPPGTDRTQALAAADSLRAAIRLLDHATAP